MKPQLLDELIAWGHGKVRSTDCIIAVDREGLPEPDIARAQRLFPKTAVHSCELRNVRSLEAFAASELADPFHLEVARITEGNLLALKMSHVLGDAVSMFLFMKAMLGHPVEDGLPELKSFPRKKDTPYRYRRNSEVWPRKGTPGRQKRFLSMALEHGEQNGPMWNDLLIYCLLEALPLERKSVWLPVNVRREFWKGFGNGLSRLRVYPPAGSTLTEKLAHIRKQKQEALRNGEVALPPPTFNPRAVHQRALYELWIRRPWADWSSLSLSHLSNTGGFLDGFTGVRGISSLMPAQNAALFAVTSGPRTDFTLTYDPAVAKDEEARKLLSDFSNNLRANL